MLEVYNSERYLDVTAYRAIKNVEREERNAVNRKHQPTRVWRNPKATRALQNYRSAYQSL